MANYDTVQKFAKIMTYVGCAFEIALAIAELCGVMKGWMSPIYYIVAVYLILLAVLFILVEIPVNQLAAWFLFLQKLLGKALFCVFLGLLCFNRHYWYTIAVAVYWWVVAVVYLTLGLIYLTNEKSNVSTTTRTTKVEVATR